MFCPICESDDLEHQEGQREMPDEPATQEGWFCPRCGWFGDEWETKEMFPPEDDF